MVLGFGVGRECFLGKVVREELIEKVILRAKPVKSEGASHNKRLGMGGEGVRSKEECSRLRG